MARLVRTRSLPLPGPDLETVFAADPGDGMVLRRGLIFRSGDYPDKSFSMTPGELAAAAADFVPVPLDLEHKSTILDDELGELRAVELTEDGTGLIGTLAVPGWLNRVFDKGDFKRRVSAAWHPTTKRLMKLGLVLNQRVPDAVLMAAFGAARAECGCGAHAPESSDASPTPEPGPMTKKEQVRAYLDALPDDSDLDEADVSLMLFPDAETDEAPAPSPVEAPAPAHFSASPEYLAMKGEIDALKTKNAATELVAFSARASSFLDHPEVRKRTVAAERVRLEQQLIRAAVDDRDHPLPVTFGADKKPVRPSRLAELEASILDRREHHLFDELVGSQPLVGRIVLPHDPVEFSEEENEKARKAKLDRNLSLTSEGRAILAERN